MLAVRIIVFLQAILFSAAKTNIRLTEIEMCDNSQYDVFMTSAQRDIDGGQQEFDFNVTVHKDVDNNNEYEISVFRVVRTKEIKLGGIKQRGACKALTEFGASQWISICQQLKIPHCSDCPLVKGTYHTVGYIVDFDATPLFKMVPRGKFKLRLEAWHGKGKIFCCTLFAERK